VVRRVQRAENLRQTMRSMNSSRQEIPVALLADKECRARAVRRRARLCSAHGDKMRHRRDRSRREKDGLRYGTVIFARRGTSSVPPALEKAGAIRPASSAERICKVFTEHANLASAERIAQYGSVPQTGVRRCESRAAIARRGTASSKPRR
jgi:hypothetical protein